MFNINSKHLKFVEMRIQGHSGADIAAAVGVSVGTIYNWQKDSDIKQLLQERRDEISAAGAPTAGDLKKAIDGGVSSAVTALDYLRGVCSGREAENKVRADVARYLVDTFLVPQITSQRLSAPPEEDLKVKQLADILALVPQA